MGSMRRVHHITTIAQMALPVSADQKAVLDREISKRLHFTAEYLFKTLENAGVVHDCTIEDVVKRCHASRKQLGRWEQKEKGNKRLQVLDQVLSR